MKKLKRMEGENSRIIYRGPKIRLLCFDQIRWSMKFLPSRTANTASQEPRMEYNVCVKSHKTDLLRMYRWMNIPLRETMSLCSKKGWKRIIL